MCVLIYSSVFINASCVEVAQPSQSSPALSPPCRRGEGPSSVSVPKAEHPSSLSLPSSGRCSSQSCHHSCIFWVASPAGRSWKVSVCLQSLFGTAFVGAKLRIDCVCCVQLCWVPVFGAVPQGMQEICYMGTNYCRIRQTKWSITTAVFVPFSFFFLFLLMRPNIPS